MLQSVTMAWQTPLKNPPGGMMEPAACRRELPVPQVKLLQNLHLTHAGWDAPQHVVGTAQALQLPQFGHAGG